MMKEAESLKQNWTEHVTEWRCKSCGRYHGKGDMCPAKKCGVSKM